MKNHSVKDWMTDKPITVSSGASLTEADVTMEAHNLRRLIVVDDGQVVGLLSLGDAREAEAKFAADGKEPLVNDIMSHDPITIPEHAGMALAAQTMLTARISGLPVVDEEGLLVGVLSESDIFRLVIEETQSGE